MEIQQLIYFHEVAETEHMTKSAERLHVAQPSLTKAIRNLEKELGVPLFVHHGRNIRLTEYGKFLHDRLNKLLPELRRLPEEVASMAKTENRTIHIAVQAASMLVTGAIIAYKKERSDIHFRFMQNEPISLPGEAANALSFYDIGITTRTAYRPVREDTRICQRTEQIFLAVPHLHPLATRKEIFLNDAAHEGFISLFGSHQFRWICDRFCAAAGFSPEIVFESDSPSAVRGMIEANLGIGFWPEYTWGEIDRHEVCLLPIVSPVCSRELIFHMQENKSDNSAVSEFFRFLCAYCDAARRKQENAFSNRSEPV